jgi:hypothetical protein
VDGFQDLIHNGHLCVSSVRAVVLVQEHANGNSETAIA